MPTEEAAAAVREAVRLRQAGRAAEAAAAFERLLARWPQLPDCWYELGLLQRRLGRPEEALQSYAAALRHGVRRPEEVHLNRAVVLTDDLRRDAEAERELETALALNPGYLPALQNLANLHEDLGRLAQAQDAYDRILAREPRAWEVLARRARLAPVMAAGDAMSERLRAGLADPAARASDRASLGFALAHRLDAAGAYAEAFAAAAAAKQASRASLDPPPRYDRAAEEARVDALIRAFPAGLPARDTAAPGAPRPVFICGMFRSGSTLAERVLAGHSQVGAAGETGLLGSLLEAPRSAPEEIAARYLSGMARRFPAAAVVTDKTLDNFLHLALIRTLFPAARIVHTTRDPLDTCLSIFMLHLDPHLAWALDLMDIGHYYRQYRRLMAHWRAVLGTDLLDFEYESFVREPEPAARRLLTHCGLDWEDSCMAPAQAAGAVKTASAWQVREPIHARAVGRARHYRRELAGLAAYLEVSP